jgi:hypothetical protein
MDKAAYFCALRLAIKQLELTRRSMLYEARTTIHVS